MSNVPERASIQRIPLPRGTDAIWLADHYFDWVETSVWIAKASSSGEEVQLHLIPFGKPAIVMTAEHRSETQVRYRVCGGWLVAGPDGGTFQFRVFDDGWAEIALIGFSPWLPRWIYTLSQAVVHGIVMRAFARHLRRLDVPLLTDETNERAAP